MALYNHYVGRFLQYLSIAMANGPLEYNSDTSPSPLKGQDSMDTIANSTAAATTTAPMQQSTQDSLLETMQILAHIPQMKLPPEYGNTFQIFLVGAALLAIIFPIFTRRAVRRAREGKMGLGKMEEKQRHALKRTLLL